MGLSNLLSRFVTLTVAPRATCHDGARTTIHKSSMHPDQPRNLHFTSGILPFLVGPMPASELISEFFSHRNRTLQRFRLTLGPRFSINKEGKKRYYEPFVSTLSPYLIA